MSESRARVWQSRGDSCPPEWRLSWALTVSTAFAMLEAEARDSFHPFIARPAEGPGRTHDLRLCRPRSSVTALACLVQGDAAVLRVAPDRMGSRTHVLRFRSMSFFLWRAALGADGPGVGRGRSPTIQRPSMSGYMHRTLNISVTGLLQSCLPLLAYLLPQGLSNASYVSKWHVGVRTDIREGPHLESAAKRAVSPARTGAQYDAAIP